MDFGIFIPPVAGSWKVAQRAEALGFTRAWFYDTPMLNSEIFSIMAVAAVGTSKIRLGTGVLVPGGRTAPVVASGLATLNALAPGRIDFGVGTGFTARRTLGLPPVKLSDMEAEIRIVTGLLAGETVEWTADGEGRPVRFLDPDVGAINIKDPIDLHISAFGPRGRAMTSRFKAGWMGAGPRPETCNAALAQMKGDWSAAGHAPEALFSTCVINGAPLRAGESHDSARVKAIAGPNVMIGLHAQMDLEERGGGGYASDRPGDLLERYRAIYKEYEPANGRYLRNHRGHQMYLRPEEEALCTPDLIRDLTWTGTKAELRDRLRQLKDGGYSHVGISVGLCPDGFLEDWVEVIEGV